ncbi:MAG: hypothetical protein QT04_C0046G0018 [archaeon GW2011_AR11]|nr:MAG: hypothetical protein QT04_C0046G0018 [archaeon GW2011_AR11]
MKAFLMPTEMLKFVRASPFPLTLMNSRMSGCHASRMPMFAPLRTPPSFISLVAASYTFMNDTGPVVKPELSMTSPLGLSLEKLKPVPAPVLWTRAA